MASSLFIRMLWAFSSHDSLYTISTNSGANVLALSMPQSFGLNGIQAFLASKFICERYVSDKLGHYV